MMRDKLLLLIAMPFALMWIALSSVLGLWESAPVIVVDIAVQLIGFKIGCLIIYQHCCRKQTSYNKEDSE